MSASLTRRSLIASAAIAAVAPAAAAASINGSTGGVSPALLRLIDEVHRCSAANKSFDEDVYDPVRDRMLAAVAEAERTLPHTVVSTVVNGVGSNLRWATDNPTAVAMCKTIGRRGSATAVNNPAAYADARRLVAASYRRKRAIKAVRESYGLAELVEQSNTLCDATATAEEAVADFPVRNIVDLHAKVALMVSRNMGDGIDRTELVLADLERIMGASA